MNTARQTKVLPFPVKHSWRYQGTAIEDNYVMPIARVAARGEPNALGIDGPEELPSITRRLWIAIKHTWMNA